MGDVLVLLRVFLAITMTCEISRAGLIVEVLLALEALAPNVVAREARASRSLRSHGRHQKAF
jgi:hypothetical protein